MGSPNGLGTTPGDGSAASLLNGAQAVPPAPKVSEREAAEWAGLLMGSMAAPVEPSRLGLSEPRQPESTGNTAQTPSNGTPANAQSSAASSSLTQSHSADTGGVNAAGPDRLILNVDSETLGRVQLVVDREEGGVRVLVGSNADAKSRLSEGKHTIREALSAAGVRVNSLRIVSSNEVGTVLAHDLLSKKNRPETERREAPEKERARSQRSKRNNLNLVG